MYDTIILNYTLFYFRKDLFLILLNHEYLINDLHGPILHLNPDRTTECGH